ncbi:hypothetical protein BRARA_B02012 [Brassica rapa]|uniref:Phytocyanin domain-containing protein n=1 Tax=Brassica campestris TaxID=3711 RepID=A0A398AB06_BRACM|nr:hypothetical protein BRARA_B02012 [Brassica rapa]
MCTLCCIIVFNFGAGHTVDEVSESDYKSCTLGNSISSDTDSHYFICAIPGHCAGRMKLSVNVGSAASSDGCGDSGDGNTLRTTPSPTVEGRKAAPSAYATAMLKPFKALTRGSAMTPIIIICFLM